ncbi:hypothetical protein FJTKL_06400 [Diaporthe vaccinii]|uniref:Uncharacterized protein n=1 Tax=Diaporthe vaccinii TaxID=105482 RepID=A0ABR4EWR2_9PEZI
MVRVTFINAQSCFDNVRTQSDCMRRYDQIHSVQNSDYDVRIIFILSFILSYLGTGSRFLLSAIDPQNHTGMLYTHPCLTRLWYHWTYRVERVCSLRVSDRCSLVLNKKGQSHMLYKKYEQVEVQKKPESSRRRILDHGSGLDDVLGSLRLILLEVLVEELAELGDLLREAISTGSPCLSWVEQLRRNVGAGLRHLEVENVVVLILNLGELARVDGIKDGTSVLQRATLATLEGTSTNPAGVEQPGVGVVVLDLVRQHLGVAHGVQSQERLGKAGREGGLWFGDTILSTSHLGSVTRDEVEHDLVPVQLGDWWQHTACVTGEQNDVAGVAWRQTWDLGVLDVLNGVGTASVFRQSGVIVVDQSGIWVEDDVLENRAELDGTEDIGLLLCRKSNTLGVAAALNGTVGVGRKGGLASAGQAEEESDVTLLALVGRRVQRQNIVLDGHLVEENGEDALLHLAGVLRSGVIDCVVGVKVLQLLTRWADEHVAHEESMVGAGTNDPHTDPVLLVPSCEPINDVNAASGVEVVDSTLAVDFPDLKTCITLETGFGCGISGVHELGRGVAPMISVTRGMWGKSRPSKVAFSSICLQRPQLSDSRGKRGYALRSL